MFRYLQLSKLQEAQRYALAWIEPESECTGFLQTEHLFLRHAELCSRKLNLRDLQSIPFDTTEKHKPTQ